MGKFNCKRAETQRYVTRPLWRCSSEWPSRVEVRGVSACGYEFNIKGVNLIHGEPGSAEDKHI